MTILSNFSKLFILTQFSVIYAYADSNQINFNNNQTGGLFSNVVADPNIQEGVQNAQCNNSCEPSNSCPSYAGVATSGEGDSSCAGNFLAPSGTVDAIEFSSVNWRGNSITIEAGRSDSSAMGATLQALSQWGVSGATLLNTNIAALQKDPNSGTLVNGGPGEANFVVSLNLDIAGCTCGSVILGQQGSDTVKPVSATQWITDGVEAGCAALTFSLTDGTEWKPSTVALIKNLAKDFSQEIDYALHESNTWWISQWSLESTDNYIGFTMNAVTQDQHDYIDKFTTYCNGHYYNSVALECVCSDGGQQGKGLLLIQPSKDSDDTFDACWQGVTDPS